MSKKVDATEAMTTATNEAIERGQEMFTKTTSAAEKYAEGMIEVNAAMFKGGEVLAKKAYDNYVANMAEAFDTAKSMAKTSDAADFMKAASAAYTKTSEKYAAQGKEFMEMSQKVMKDNTEIAKKFYSSAFAAV